MTTNPGGPIIVSLTQFVENSITALYAATTDSAFNSAFDEFLLKDAKITVNGRQLNLAQYKAQLLGERPNDKYTAKVSFHGGVEVPTNAKEPLKAGVVGIFYTVAIHLNHLPITNTVRSSLNVTVVDHGIKNGVEERKISTLDQVLLEDFSRAL